MCFNSCQLCRWQPRCRGRSLRLVRRSIGLVWRRWANVCPHSIKNFKVIVAVRPWIRVDGTLNRRVLDRLLGAALGIVMQVCLQLPRYHLQPLFRLQARLSPLWLLDCVQHCNQLTQESSYPFSVNNSSS